MRARLDFCFKPDRADGLQGVVRVDCGADGAWLVRVANAQAEALDDGAVVADATITTDGGTYALVQTGRRPASIFAERGRLQVSGDTTLAEGLVTVSAVSRMALVRGGRNTYGQAIGILMMDTSFPRIPGDIGNATTFDFPVRYQVVKGASPDRLVLERDPCVAQPVHCRRS